MTGFKRKSLLKNVAFSALILYFGAGLSTCELRASTELRMETGGSEAYGIFVKLRVTPLDAREEQALTTKCNTTRNEIKKLQIHRDTLASCLKEELKCKIQLSLDKTQIIRKANAVAVTSRDCRKLGAGFISDDEIVNFIMQLRGWQQEDNALGTGLNIRLAGIRKALEFFSADDLKAATNSLAALFNGRTVYRSYPLNEFLKELLELNSTIFCKKMTCDIIKYLLEESGTELIEQNDIDTTDQDEDNVIYTAIGNAFDIPPIVARDSTIYLVHTALKHAIEVALSTTKILAQAARGAFDITTIVVRDLTIDLAHAASKHASGVALSTTKILAQVAWDLTKDLTRLAWKLTTGLVQVTCNIGGIVASWLAQH